MRAYTFRYIKGSSGPFETLTAENDEEFYKKRDEFLAKDPQRRLIPDTTFCNESGRVADLPPRPAT